LDSLPLECDPVDVADWAFLLFTKMSMALVLKISIVFGAAAS
jgi:hypothetical protein